MTERQRISLLKASGGAEWYFVAATFAFVASTFVFTGGGWVFGILTFALGVLLIVLGAIVWSRAAKAASSVPDADAPADGHGRAAPPPPQL